jgi:hypothetical protein
MPDIPQNNAAAKDDPVPLRTKFFDQFKGVYTRAGPSAIPEGYFANLENIIPIGDENAHVVHNISASLFNYGTDDIYWSQGVNLLGVEYLVNFASNGKVFFYNIGSGVSTWVNSGTLLSGSGSQLDQWQNTKILLIDSTGYYTYDGTTFTKVTGTGVPTTGDSIAVYSGYVWIVAARNLYVSGLYAPGTVDPTTATGWTAAVGAQIVALTDPQIRAKVRRLKAQNGYLYLIADSSINAISDVYIPTGVTPTFSNQNIQALIGSDQAGSIFAYDRLLMFASRYGAHTLYGVSAPKVSGDIDGTWQYIDFSQAISGGQVVVENILCGAFLIKRLNDPDYGSNTIITLWFQNTDTSPQTGVTETTDIWWFANFGPLTFIVTGFQNNVPTLFGFLNNQLYQLFADPTTAPNVVVSTKRWHLEDPMARKEAITAGFEAFYFLYGTSLEFSIDTDDASYPLAIQLAIAQGPWINALSQQGQWINAASQTGSWVAPSTYQIPADAQGIYDWHIGMTLRTSGYNFELHHLAFDYKLRDRWL